MSKKSFLLVSLNENKTKKLAEVISNNTCRKMLDYLADKKDATESDMAKDLKIPISTVHYNMKALLTAKLVKSDEYHYSSKGKEVSHYRLANQYVIIAPEGEKNAIREKLKSIIPTALIMGAAAGIIKIFSGSYGFSSIANKAAAPMMEASVASGAGENLMRAVPTMAADEVAVQAAYAMDSSVQEEAVQAVAEHAPEIAMKSQAVVSHAPEIALWFFIGAVAGIAAYLLVDYIVKRIKQ
ncbi:MAG: helix-turn-helix domain-containing protein [Candidatus Woesearchaeota archaeon]